MGNQIYDETKPLVSANYISSTDSTDWVAVLARPMDYAYRLDGLYLYNGTDAIQVVEVGLCNIAVTPNVPYPIALVSLPASAGDGTVAHFDVLAALAATLAGGLAITAQYSAYLRMTVALTGEDKVYYLAAGGVL